MLYFEIIFTYSTLNRQVQKHVLNGEAMKSATFHFGFLHFSVRKVRSNLLIISHFAICKTLFDALSLCAVLLA